MLDAASVLAVKVHVAPRGERGTTAAACVVAGTTLTLTQLQAVEGQCVPTHHTLRAEHLEVADAVLGGIVDGARTAGGALGGVGLENDWEEGEKGG